MLFHHLSMKYQNQFYNINNDYEILTDKLTHFVNLNPNKS